MTTSKQLYPFFRLRLFFALLATGASLHAQSTGLVVSSSNQVGIGTTTPSYKLTIQGGDNNNPGLFVNGGGATNPTFIATGRNGGIDGIFGVAGINGNYWTSAGAGDIVVRSNGTKLNLATGYLVSGLTLDTSGNIGIGTTSPQGLLHLYQTANAPTLYMQTNFSGGNAFSISPFITGISNNGFQIKDETNNVQRLVITSSGNVGIGTTSPAYALDVAGQVHATSFVSSTQTYADFVFKSDYKLASLSDVESSIKKEGHLPGIPSEEEAKAHGIDLTQMQVKLLQKIEELTLHQIEQQKLMEDQARRLDEQSKRIDQLEQENTALHTAH